jgi:hypothetical protein
LRAPKKMDTRPPGIPAFGGKATARGLQKIPTFLYIGADRCGSTWILRVLSEHPNIVIPKIGTPFFFDRYYDRGWEWYRNLFGTPDETVLAAGEFSHDYLFSADAARRIRSDLPHVRLLVSLRQPLEKAYSAHHLSRNAGEIRDDFDHALRTSDVLLEQVLYHKHLSHYYDLFPREQIKVMMFDDLGRRPHWFISQILEFLGVPEVDGLPWDQVFNARALPRAKWLGFFAKNLANTARALQAERLLAMKYDSRVRSIFYRKEGAGRTQPAIGRSAFDRVRPIVDEQIEKLSSLTGQDFSPWLRHDAYIKIS